MKKFLISFLISVFALNFACADTNASEQNSSANLPVPVQNLETKKKEVEEFRSGVTGEANKSEA